MKTQDCVLQKHITNYRWKMFISRDTRIARERMDYGAPLPDNRCWPTWPRLDNSFRRLESRGNRDGYEVAAVQPLYDDIRRVDGRVGTCARVSSFIFDNRCLIVRLRDRGYCSRVLYRKVEKFRRQREERHKYRKMRKYHEISSKLTYQWQLYFYIPQFSLVCFCYVNLSCEIIIK